MPDEKSMGNSSKFKAEEFGFFESRMERIHILRIGKWLELNQVHLQFTYD